MRKLLEITIAKELKHEPVLYQSIRNYAVIINIIEASFSSDVGWALLSIEGDDAEVEKVLDFWKEKNITIDIREES